VQQRAATFFEQAEAAAGADLPQFVREEFDAFLDCSILANGFLQLRCDDCGHDKLVAFCAVWGQVSHQRRAARTEASCAPLQPCKRWG